MMKPTKVLFCAAAALAALSYTSASAQTQKYSTPQLQLPLMQTAPKIDGTINEKEWKGADRMERFGRSAPLSPQKASFWVGADAQNLYIAVRTETPPDGNILRRVNPLPGDADTQSYSDDSIEIYLSPNPDAPAAERRTYQGIFNAKGAIYDQLMTGKGAEAWRGKWQIKNKVSDNYWDCEIALPWSSVGVDSAPLGKTMALRIGRNWRRSIAPAQTEWSPLGGAYIDLSTMARVTWDANAPTVQVLQLQDAPDERANVKLQISNPTNAPVKVLSLLEMAPQNSAPTHNEQTLEIAAQSSKILEIGGASLPEEAIVTNIEVTSPDKKTVYYKRNFSWQIDRPKTIWVLDTNAEKRIETQFAYFPSFNAIHAKVNFANLQQRNDVKGVQLAIRKKGSTQNIAQTTMPALKNSGSELLRWDIPKLDEGEYELITQLQGVDVKPQIQSFVRRKFPWEGNQLGLSDRVIAPFTPITVKGNEIGAVLRQHQMNGVGLWNQVVADKQSLLKIPMRIEATIGGKVLLAQGQLKVLSHKDTQAVAEAKWQAGALQGTTRNVWDYDGVMKSTFTLQPTNTKIDALSIVIPLDDAQVKLMHAATDGPRINYAGDIPAGEGVIWDSTKAAHNSIIGNYVPYLWVGDQERGFAVFGDNDAGWITDDKTACQQLIRKADGTLELRLNLIQKPTNWQEARQIILGFQATPVKPMPQNWRLWTVGASVPGNYPGRFRQGWFGSDYYWGAATPFSDFYPRHQDFRIYDELAKTRQTGVIPKDFIKEWLDGYTYADGKRGETQRNTYARHMGAAFRIVAGQPDGMLVYTNGRGVRYDTPEGQTFLNEWNRNPFPQREWAYASGNNYDVDPNQSYRDYTAWYWQKMLTTFDDAIYWDNVFLQSNFNPINSAAYVRDDGHVQPAASLWNTRELVRRGAILVDELGKTNRNMVHMTNTAISPILSFASSQLTWEDHSGDQDFQDRFSRDYIQAEGIGRQFGNLPVALTWNQIRTNGADAQQKKLWVNRTAAGVMLTHEIKPLISQGRDDPFLLNYARLLEFGYGQPSVNVYNYWQKSYPAKISGETSSLLVSKGNKAILIVCDWGNGGDFTAQLDTKVLSLQGNLKATDAESGKLLSSSGNAVSFSLKKHDFKVIQIEAQ